MHFTPKKFRQTLSAVILILASHDRALAAATFTPLGDLPGGGIDSYPNAVSADGSVVVGESSSANGTEAFRWTADGGMVALGDLQGGVFQSSAVGVSADGSVVVGRGNETHLGSGTEAFRWTADGGLVGLGDLPGGLSFVGAHGVSADGSVVVGFGQGSRGNRSIRWTAGGMTALFDSPHDGSSASAISADGSVVVGTIFPPGQAYRWTEGGGMVRLVGPPDSLQSDATGVSADGSVIVGEVSRFVPATNSALWEAYRWTADGGMVRLGVLPQHDESYALGVSADGSVVVGYSYGTDDPFTSFYWTELLGMVSLQDLLIAQGATNLTGWNLDGATGVSADGRTIVGLGTNPAGNPEAWLARLEFGPAVAGDFNQDGSVDAADYVVWRHGLGTTYTSADYDAWRANFGRTSASAGAATVSSLGSTNPAVPEPTAACLILIGLTLHQVVARGSTVIRCPHR